MAPLVAAGLALVACGSGSGSGSSSSSQDLSDSKYVGTWKATEMTLAEASESFDEWTLVMNADGTGQSISDEETTNFTWELTSDGFKTKGDVKTTFTDNGDNSIKTNILGADILFEKQQ